MYIFHRETRQTGYSPLQPVQYRQGVWSPNLVLPIIYFIKAVLSSLSAQQRVLRSITLRTVWGLLSSFSWMTMHGVEAKHIMFMSNYRKKSSILTHQKKSIHQCLPWIHKEHYLYHNLHQLPLHHTSLSTSYHPFAHLLTPWCLQPPPLLHARYQAFNFVSSSNELMCLRFSNSKTAAIIHLTHSNWCLCTIHIRQMNAFSRF